MATIEIALPHLVLRPEEVVTEPPDGWLVAAPLPGEAPTVFRDGEALGSWDGLRTLELSRRIHLPRALAQTLCLAPESARFALIVTVATGGGLLRDIVFRRDLLGVVEGPIDILLRPDSSRLSRDLHLLCALVLVSSGLSAQPLAPSSVGSRLWSNATRLYLDGGKGRLPVEATSFRKTFARRGLEEALYHVEIVPFLELDVEQAVRVYLNADYPNFVNGVAKRDPLPSSILWSGVLRRLMSHILSDTLVMEGNFEAPSSLGYNLRRWIAQAFSGMSLDQIRALARSSPSHFEAMIESWSGLERKLFAVPGEP